MKKAISVCLCLLMLLSLIPMQASAAEWTKDAPTVSLSASELEDGVMSVTIHVSESELIYAYALAIEYNSNLVEVASDLGDYDTGGRNPETIGLTITSDDPYFPYNETYKLHSIQYNPTRQSETAGNLIFQIADAQTDGITEKGMDATFFFRLKDGVGGGVAEFQITNQRIEGSDTYKLANEAGDTAPFPTENNSATVAIPFTTIPVVGELTTPAKGGEDESDLASTSNFVDVAVTWDPALTEGKNDAGETVYKFAADTAYTATVTVSAKGGAAFSGSETVDYSGKSGLTFKAEESGGVYTFVATKEFEKTDSKEITAMEITTQPTKLSGYVDGDAFDTAGMVVKATYDDESVDEDYTNYNVTPATLTKGTTSVTITSKDKASLTATVDLTAAVEGKTEGFAAEFSPAELTEEYTGEDLIADFTRAITHTGVDGTVTYTFKSGSDEAKTVVNVGKYDVYASVAGDSHYADIDGVKIATAEVTKKTVAPTVADIDDQTYTGKAITPAVTVNCDQALTADADYTVEYSNNIDAGEATVTVKSVETSNYAFEDVTKSFTVKPYETAVGWTGDNLYYNGNEQAPTPSAAGVEGETLTLTVIGAGTDSGQYTVSASIESVTGGRAKAENYKLTGESCTYYIQKGDYEGVITDAVTAPAKGAEDKVFDISALELPESFKDVKVVSARPGAEPGIVTDVSKSGDAAVKFSTSAADDGATGKFTIVLSSKNWNNVTATVTVTAKTLELPEGFWEANVEVTSPVEYGTKNGEAVTLNESVTIKDPEDNDVSGTLSVKDADAVQNMGSTTVTVVANFDGTEFEKEFAVDIDMKIVMLTWENTDLIYNGEKQAPTASAEGVNGETLVITVSGEQTDAGENYGVWADITSVTGGNASVANYCLGNAYTEFSIAQKEVTISGITAENKTYDGKTDAELTYDDVVITGKIDGDDLSVTAKGAFADADAGKDKTVAISELTLTGEDKDNYKLAAEGQQTEAKADIDPKVVKFDVSLEKESVEYNGEEQAPVVTVRDGETVLTADKDYTVTVDPATCKDAAEYKITVAGAGNYEGSTADELTYTITPKPLTDEMVADIEDQTYTGAAIEPVSVKDGETELAADTDYTVTYASNIDAGEATVTIEGKGNYSGTLNKTFTINALEVEVEWTDTELTYTGEALKPAAAAKGVEGETITLTVTGEQTDAGKYTATAEIASVEGGQAKAENYKLTGDTVDFEIKAAEFTGTVAITADADPIVEDVTLTADVSGAKGDELTYQWNRDGEAIEGATAETYKVAAEDVGTEITVTVTSEGNYVGELTSESVKPLGPPTFESVSAAADVNSITVTWELNDNGSPVTEVTVTVSHEGDDDIVVQAVEGENSVTVDELLESTAYTVKVTAVNAIGSAESDEIAVQTKAEETIYTVTVEETEGGKVEVSATEAEPYSEVTVTVTPDEGYELDKLSVTNFYGTEIAVSETENGYTFTMPASDVTIKATFKTAEEPFMPFVDVEAGSYYEDAVYWAVAEGVTNGTSATTFSPYESCTRAEAVTFLWRAAGSPEPASAESPFKDVTDTQAFYYKAVLWAYENGVTKGTSETEFSPFLTVSRCQMVTFLYRMSGEKAEAADIPFSDVKADAYYAESVMWAVSKGITNGTTATTFSPDDDCLRCQAVLFLYRYLA